MIINGTEVKNAGNIVENVQVGTKTMNFSRCVVADAETEKRFENVQMFGFNVCVKKAGNRLDTTVDKGGIVLFAQVSMHSAMQAIANLTSKSFGQVDSIWKATRSNKTTGAGRTDGSTLTGLTVEVLEKMLADAKKAGKK